ncbi:MAG: SpoIID/LytB domain-containing protein [Bacillota bacterium]
MQNPTGFRGTFILKRQVLVLALLILILLYASALIQAQEQLIKVGLINETNSVKLLSPSGIKLETSDGYTLNLDSKTSFYFEKEDESIRINNYYFDSDYILVSPLDEGEFLNLESRDYNGIIKLLNNGETMTVINKVSLTDYLASVIGSEIDPNWSLEALKAQAVVARTYALRNLDANVSKGYHLCNTIYSQSYKGHHVTTSKIYQAVEETKGEVLTYNQKLIHAVYHSNAGGETAQGSIIWGGDTPYLQSVDSNDYVAPNYEWQKKYSSSKLKEILAEKEVKLTEIREIKLKDLGPSGRPGKVVIEGAQQQISIDSSKFRFWLNLRSTKFTVTKLKTEFLFKGKGWGHGVGMSQWGAYQMAKEGYNYREILEHYYQNTKLVKNHVGGIEDES